MKKIKKTEFHIDCKIFSQYEEKIKKLLRAINDNKVVSEKVDDTQMLLALVEKLSACPKYSKEKIECEDCRLKLNLLKENAKSIIRANEITS